MTNHAGEIRTCPRCGQTWRYTAGHFYCHPKAMGEVIAPIIAELKDRGFTLKMIGERLGVDRRTVGAWRDGVQNPSPDHLAALKWLAEHPQDHGP